MKHFSLLALIAVFLSSPLWAQQFHGGLKLGVTTTQVAGDTYAGFNKAGINGGAFVNLGLGNQLAAQLELAYFMKGSRFNDQPDLPDFKQYLLRLNYIEMPVLLQYELSGFVFEAGVSFDFLLSSFEEKDYLQVSQNDWRKMTLNSVFGIMYSMSEKWMLSFRTVNSITSVRKNAVPGNVKRYGSKFGEFNDALLLSVYYIL